MKQDKNDVKLGRFLSMVLRHNPGAANIMLDEHGWADVPQLLAGVKRSGRHITMERLERIVSENNKQRYSFNPDHTKIRANQGHSIDVDVELIQKMPPAILYHGTATGYLDGILKQGLLRQNRRHVHLSQDWNTAVSVGRRHGKPVVLEIDAAAMAQDGHQFWVSENKVWLCQHVPRQYLQIK